MTAAAPQPAQPRKSSSAGAADFERLADGALRDHVVGTQERPSAADVEPRQLLRYAAGRAHEDERSVLEDLVKRSRWAYDRVVALVRANRPNHPNTVAHLLAKRLLGAKQEKAVAIAGRAILEVEGASHESLEAAWKTLEKTGNDKTRAACLIGLGRHEDARKLIASHESDREPGWNLLRRVSSAACAREKDDEADEEALLALLDVFPSL